MEQFWAGEQWNPVAGGTSQREVKRMESTSIWPGRGGLDPPKNWKFRCVPFMSHAPSGSAKTDCLPAALVEAEAGEIIAG